MLDKLVYFFCSSLLLGGGGTDVSYFAGEGVELTVRKKSVVNSCTGDKGGGTEMSSCTIYFLTGLGDSHAIIHLADIR